VSILAALSLAAPVVASAGTTRGLSRTRPLLRNAKRANRRLDAALEQHVDDIKPGATLDYGVTFNQPSKQGFEGFNDVRNNQILYGSSTPPSAAPHIAINPNADRAYYAHEMGHLASQKTDVGHFVASLRENPKLKNALLGAMVTIPGVAAALETGDNDMDTSIATRHGLAIMDKAGMRATLGQRGKLAGGLLSYLAAPMIAGASANVVGNMFDDDTIAPY
jgi:hypothetical protein